MRPKKILTREQKEKMISGVENLHANEGLNINEACKKFGIGKDTYYRAKNEIGGGRLKRRTKTAELLEIPIAASQNKTVVAMFIGSPTNIKNIFQELF